MDNECGSLHPAFRLDLTPLTARRSSFESQICSPSSAQSKSMAPKHTWIQAQIFSVKTSLRWLVRLLNPLNRSKLTCSARLQILSPRTGPSRSLLEATSRRRVTQKSIFPICWLQEDAQAKREANLEEHSAERRGLASEPTALRDPVPALFV
jgi:hypothetical protein